MAEPSPGRDVARDPVKELLLGLPGELELAAERGLPVVFVTDREPARHVRELMRTLGVPVEVRPVSAAVNQDVRVAAGTDGQIVVVGAWCSRCRQESMPNRDGCCSFCGSLIVDEDSLSARAMREQLANPQPAPALRPAPGDAAPVARVLARRSERPQTREEIVASFHRFRDEHGRWPLPVDVAELAIPWLPAGTPNQGSPITRHFGTWGGAWKEICGTKIPWARQASIYRKTGRLPAPRAEVSGPEPLAQQPPESEASGQASSGDRLTSPGPADRTVERGSGPDEAPPGLGPALITAARAFADTLERELG